MYIYNVTFAIANEDQEEFLGWLRKEALGKLANSELGAREPRLTKVAEVPGDPDFAVQAASYALQMEFSSIEEAKRWADIALMEVGGMFTIKFGQDRGMMFTTILEVIAL